MVEAKLYVLGKGSDVEHRTRKGSRCSVNIARCPFSKYSLSSSAPELSERAYKSKVFSL